MCAIRESSRFGTIGLVIATAEIFVIWGGVYLLAHLNLWVPRSRANGYFGVLYGMGLLTSATYSVLGVARDRQKIVAVLALLLTVANIWICIVPIAF